MSIVKSYNILKIIFLLLLNEKVTVKELSEELEVSSRTVKRYLATIEGLDLPIETVRGKNGGIYFDKNEFYEKYGVSSKEIDYIIDSLYTNNSLEYLFRSGYPDFSDILRKIRLNNFIEIDFSKWLNSTEDDVNFSLIKRGILTSQQIDFDYYDMYNHTSHRVIDPYKIGFKESDWYVLGWCHLRNDIRIFKIRKMRKVHLLGVSFIRDEMANFNFQAYFENSEKVTLKMLVSSRAAAKVYEDFENREIQKQGDSFFVTSTRVNNPNLLSLVMSYGKNAKVLSPGELIGELVKNAEAVKNFYKGTEFVHPELV